jgi:predicted  nucleic acid-binding Zn-ribbon protein
VLRRDNYCTACGMVVGSQIGDAVRSGSGIHLCECCGRILVPEA